MSNLGMFGVSQFGAILPPGTGAILAVGAAAPVVEVQPPVPMAGPLPSRSLPVQGRSR